MNRKIEIVSPAGNSEKLAFAVKYGADAVYFGGDRFNLRVQSGNFSIDEIRNAVSFCRENGVKSIFLMNSFVSQKEIEELINYALSLKDIKFDAVMISDPGMLEILQTAGFDCEFHLSTQMNTLNSLAADFWKKAGFSRIVLAREATVEEIKNIRQKTGIELEIFVHGALCIAYSGRCLLSRYLSGRDANKGDCAQSCRWKYSLIEEKRPGNYLDIIEHATGTEILSSKDLCLIDRLEEYIEAGVDAFKIEGRMKSLYHTANTTRIYKHAASLAGTPDFAKHLPFWLGELDLISHRPYTNDLFNEFGGLAFTGVPYLKKAVFCGYAASTGLPGLSKELTDENEVWVRVSNPIYEGETLEAIFPIKDKIIDGNFTVEKIYDSALNRTRMARPADTALIKFDRRPADDAVFRKRLPQEAEQ